ncbi:hypothetical protein UPYG_G00099060 [Umbra pygmaea]|uniref:BMERB domain-containing protein n=1 Tax=Umbra pygmaea TaxID=75934 RepID=A0ABD0X4E3_UMBPY
MSISDSEEDVFSGIVEKMETNATFQSFATTTVVNACATSLQTPPGASNPPTPIPSTRRVLSLNPPHHSSEGFGTNNGSYSTPPLVPVWHRVPTPTQPRRGFEGLDSTNGSYSPATCPSPKEPKKRSAGSKNGGHFAPTNSSRSEIRSPLSSHIPMDQILKELHLIEEGLGDLEREGVDMEKRLRSCEEDGKGDVLMDPLMVDWFKLIQKKQMYIRRESELVYIAKTQDLEEQQPGVEGELRRLLEKPDHLKTSGEHQRECRLMERLMEIVNGRNAIVEGLDKDRLREGEEDERLNDMMQTLGITNKIKKSSSFKKLFRRRSCRKVTVIDQNTVF